MTEMTDQTPPAPEAPGSPQPAPQRRPLRRSESDKVFGGVAGGLGDYFGVDPLLFRVLFVAAAFFSGAGILAYLIAWLAIPEQGTDRAKLDGAMDWARDRGRSREPWLVALLAA